MGGQHSLIHKGSIYEDQGKYIIPTKLKHSKPTLQSAIVKNIFGINDPAIIPDTFWAIDESNRLSNFTINDKHPNSLTKSLTKSRKYTKSASKFNLRYSEFELAHSEKRDVNILSNFSRTRTISEDENAKSLGKISPQYFIPKPKDLQSSIMPKSRPKHQNFNISENLLTISDKQNNNKGLSYLDFFYGKNSQLKQKNSAMNPADKNQLKSALRQIDQNILDSLQTLNCCPESSLIHKTENELTQRSIINDQQKLIFDCGTASIQDKNSFNEQTFSRYQQNPLSENPSNLNRGSQSSNFCNKPQKSDFLVQQKVNSKITDIAKYNGLKEDYKNQSSLKGSKKSFCIKIGLVVQNSNQAQNSNQIQKVNQKKEQFSSSKKSWSSEVSNLKKNGVSIVNNTQNNSEGVSLAIDRKSSIYGSKSCLKKNFKPDSYRNYEALIRQRGSRQLETSQIKIGSLRSDFHNSTENDKNQTIEMNSGLGGQNNRKTSEKHNTSEQPQEKCSQAQSFKFSKLKSPKSIASQQVKFTKPKISCNKFVETSKADQKNHLSSFKSKKYPLLSKQDSFLKKDCNEEGRKEIPNAFQMSARDQKLLYKIQNLESELEFLRSKQQLQKFESRRYSPVKDEKSRKQSIENQQHCCQEKYCIKQFSKATPFKHRSQYFKLKLK